VSEATQIERLSPVLADLAALGVPVSVDTTRAAVADFALGSGAAIINDVSAGRDDPGLSPLVASRGAGLVLMHMLGQPATMQQAPHYRDVVGEVRDFLAGRIDAAVAAGVPRERVIVDPGIGFGKTVEHNLALLAGLGALAELGCPVLVGPSRKRFIGVLTGDERPTDRVSGTVAACLESLRRGATIFRVHDVAPLVAALKVACAIRDVVGPQRRQRQE
jgi:dihydropteroate synthase